MTNHSAIGSEVTGEQIDDLVQAVRELAEEVRALRETLDEFREDYQWAIRNTPDTDAGPRVHVTSMALDPTADDFGERLNAVPSDVIARLRDEAVNQHHSRDCAEVGDSQVAAQTTTAPKSTKPSQVTLF